MNPAKDKVANEETNDLRRNKSRQKSRTNKTEIGKKEGSPTEMKKDSCHGLSLFETVRNNGGVEEAREANSSAGESNKFTVTFLRPVLSFRLQFYQPKL